MEPASKDDITPQEYWRLRYTAFLCAIFDVLSTLVAEGAFRPVIRGGVGCLAMRSRRFSCGLSLVDRPVSLYRTYGVRA